MKKAIKRNLLIIPLCLIVAASFSFNIMDLLPSAKAINNSLPDTALVLIDIWGENPWAEQSDDPQITVWIEWWENDVSHHIDEKILPLLKEARGHNMTIVFSSPNIALSPRLEQLIWGEPIINLAWDLDYYFKGKGIKNIIYAGYALNMCVLTRPTGVRKMHSLGYNITVIEDCSLCVPNISFSYEEAIEEIKEVGSLITSDEFFDMLDGKRQ